MSDVLQTVAAESLRLDRAFQRGEVTAEIEAMALKSQEEVDDAASRGNAGGQDAPPLV